MKNALSNYASFYTTNDNSNNNTHVSIKYENKYIYIICTYFIAKNTWTIQNYKYSSIW